jgi:hypothetical protein
MRIKAKGCDYALLHLPPLRFTVPEDGGMIGIESDIDRNGSEASLNNSQPPDPPLISLHTTWPKIENELQLRIFLFKLQFTYP